MTKSTTPNNPEAAAFDRRIIRPMKGPHWTNEKDLPADTGWAGYDQLRTAHFSLVADHRKNQAARSKNERDQAVAQQDYPAQAAAALRAGDKAPADPLPKLEEQAAKLVREGEVLAAAVLQSCDAIRDNVHANREEYKATDQGQLAEALEDATVAHAVLVEAVDRVHKVRVQDNWLRGQKAVAQPIGSAELNKLAEYLEQAATARQLLYVDSRNFKRLKEGDDAEAIDGTKVPADTPLSAVVLVHTPHGAWGPTPDRMAVRPTEGGAT
jgi:hypothetical protein